MKVLDYESTIRTTFITSPGAGAPLQKGIMKLPYAGFIGKSAKMMGGNFPAAAFPAFLLVLVPDFSESAPLHYL